MQAKLLEMKEADFSSWQKVNALKAAQAILKVEERRFLEPFVSQEKSVGEAAAELGVAVDSMAYRVRRLKGLGLLTHTRSEARKGRAKKYYRAGLCRRP